MAPSDALDPAAGEEGAAAAAGEPEPEVVEVVDTVLVTISKNADGKYVVRAGDEPEAVAAAPGEEAVAQAGAEPVMVDSIGEALKAALEILQADGGEGAAEDEAAAEADFQGGFTEGKDPSPAQKY